MHPQLEKSHKSKSLAYNNTNEKKEVYMQVVTICIKNQQNKLLIQKRSQSKGGKYGITSGHTLAGEEAKQGAIREIKEEISLNVEKQELKLIYKIEIDKVIYNLYYVQKEIDVSKVFLQKEEVENVYWYTLEEINNLIQENEFYDKQIEAFKIFEKYIKEEILYGNNSPVGYKQ